MTFPQFVLQGDRTLITGGMAPGRAFDEQGPDAPVLEVVFGSDTGPAPRSTSAAGVEVYGSDHLTRFGTPG
nr:hypothetical protein GCM10017745_37520 [Saccharothrix mutabilis subsp. capreolus]